MYFLRQIPFFTHVCKVMDSWSVHYNASEDYLPACLFVKLFIALGVVGFVGGKSLEFWSLCISLVMGLLA